MINVSGSNLAIGISLVMRDGFSAQSRIASANMSKLEAQAHKLATAQMTMARNANAAGAALGAAALRGLAGWVKQGAEFEYTLKYVSSITNATVGQYDKLNKRAVTLGESTMFTAHQIADGMRWMAQAGMDATSIYNSMQAIANLAGATMSSIEGRGGAADWVTNIAKAFDIELNQTNVTKISDVIAAAVNKSNMKLHEFGEAMKYTQSTARDLNMTFEETSAGIMVLANAGIQGTMAGTALENMMRYVTKAAGSSATSRQTRALGILGMTQQDLQDRNGDLLSYGAILTKVSKIASTMGNVDAQNALIDLFGVRGKRGASTIARKLTDYYKFLDQLNNSGGEAARTMKDMMSTVEGSLLQLTSAWTSFKIAYEDSLAPILTPVLKTLTAFIKILNSIARTSTGKILLTIATGFVLMKTVTMAFRAVLFSIKLVAGDVGVALVSSTAAGTRGLNTMAAAATRARASMAGMFGGGSAAMAAGGINYMFGSKNRGGVKYAKNGRPYIIGPGGGAQFISQSKANLRHTYGGKLGGMFGNMKKPTLPKMGMRGVGGLAIGGLGLGLAANAAGGNDTALGQGLNVGATTLNMAGMGAMVGSIFPVVGTAAGAVVGGVAGLLWGLYDNMKAVENKVNEAESSMKADPVFKEGKWQFKPIDQSDMERFKWQGAPGSSMNPWFDKEKSFTSFITVNLNNETVYDAEIDEPNHTASVGLNLQ